MAQTIPIIFNMTFVKCTEHDYDICDFIQETNLAASRTYRNIPSQFSIMDNMHSD
jgi:hypothetical protein